MSNATERIIDPSNYLELAGGREDIAAALRMQDEVRVEAWRKETLIDDRIIPTLGALTIEQLEVIATTAANMARINVNGRQDG